MKPSPALLERVQFVAKHGCRSYSVLGMRNTARLERTRDPEFDCNHSGYLPPTVAGYAAAAVGVDERVAIHYR